MFFVLLRKMCISSDHNTARLNRLLVFLALALDTFQIYTSDSFTGLPPPPPPPPKTQVIGAGPTGVEFTGELTDLIGNDVPRLFPELIGLINLTVVSSGKVLPMFEEVY